MNDTQELEDYLLNRLPVEDRLLMEARLLLSEDLREKAFWQQQTYALIKQHGRQVLKAEIAAVHTKLFTEKKFETFRQNILSLFKL